ncbi:Fe(3+) ions import ATP-binding protein FbpC [Candidatus Desulfarcum epimagneticum]|uniref:Fe(3+) ions import ATP-binding protein FbpC n=1 Tax=uncultured Desulfobacteraceae bacterium TaxID=218296 RepID=A0A484HCD3_9BACT|nr:Fe(3+) ions import ATP-binding protein FbpC [uncultured Desulfobacteraceae bacterium]
MPILEISHVEKKLAGKTVLKSVSLSHEKGGILCLLGPSGSGKTTLLRIIAGLEKADRGAVCFDGRDMAGVKTHRRRFGMMFQEFALFPHKNVFDNIAFGLEMENRAKPEIEKRVREMLALTGLEGFEKRDVADLSGGERQRTALARSLAPRPRLLLLDEPMGALDRALRERLMMDLKRIIKAVGTTTVFVTHDQAEAFAVSDSVAVMDMGEIRQQDSPENLYRRPASEGVARFLGFKNILKGRADENGRIETRVGTLEPPKKQAPGARVMAVIRPRAARLVDAKNPPPPDAAMVVSGIARERVFKGGHFQTCLETQNKTRLYFDLASPPPEGETARAALVKSEIWIVAP